MGIATVYRLINRLEQIGVLAKARSLGINRVRPQLGNITAPSGEKLRVSNRLELNDLIRMGLISAGVIGVNNKIDLSLVGERIDITVTK